MNIDGEKHEPRRYHVLAKLTPDEHARVVRMAASRGLTKAGLVRRAINTLLLDEGDEALLIEEYRPAGGRRGRRHAA